MDKLLSKITSTCYDAGFTFDTKGDNTLVVYYPKWDEVIPHHNPPRGEYFCTISADTILRHCKKLRISFENGETAYLTVKEISNLLYGVFDINFV